MLDLDNELNTTGIPFKNLYWVKAPSYPYGIFDDIVTARGDDEHVRALVHDTTIELYSQKIDVDSEKKIEKWLINKNYGFKRTRYWVESEKHFQTIYEFSFIEKL